MADRTGPPLVLLWRHVPGRAHAVVRVDQVQRQLAKAARLGAVEKEAQGVETVLQDVGERHQAAPRGGHGTDMLVRIVGTVAEVDVLEFREAENFGESFIIGYLGDKVGGAVCLRVVV